MLRLQRLDSKPKNTWVKLKCQSQYTAKSKLQLLPLGCIRWKTFVISQEPKIQCQVTDDKREAKYGIYFIMTTFLCINNQYLHTGDESIVTI